MANFKTHITLSSFFGMGYAAAGHLAYDIPLPSAVLAGGLCSIAGMLPDVDSDHGVPLRETMAFLAAVTPMFLLDRFRSFGLTDESIVLAAALIYVTIRFGVAEFVRRRTVHRGMWHSIPAAAIAGLITYHLCLCPDFDVRLYKTGAVLLGFLSHLVLDEVYATDLKGRRPRFKRSFGTALKMWGKHPSANLITYAGVIVLLSVTAWDSPTMRPWLAPNHPHQSIPHTAHEPPPYPDAVDPYESNRFDDTQWK